MTEVQLTADGSHTLYSSTFEQHYHSLNGALEESLHIYIGLGLRALATKPQVNILEMGFGTGLNALLTWQETEQTSQKINYTTLEAYPIGLAQAQYLNYQGHEKLLALHACSWEEKHTLSPQFSFRKHHTTLQDFEMDDTYDLVYYDAFSPRRQPELWTAEVFTKIAQAMPTGGVLVTYSCKGIVQRALQEAGFSTEKPPGPIGKSKVLRAVKI